MPVTCIIIGIITGDRSEYRERGSNPYGRKTWVRFCISSVHLNDNVVLTAGFNLDRSWLAVTGTITVFSWASMNLWSSLWLTLDRCWYRIINPLDTT
jgi:hypothetical protein